MAEIAYLPGCCPVERSEFNRARRLAVLILAGSVIGFWAPVIAWALH